MKIRRVFSDSAAIGLTSDEKQALVAFLKALGGDEAGGAPLSRPQKPAPVVHHFEQTVEYGERRKREQ